MYVRVKRARTTMFLHVDPTETVLELKQKIQVPAQHPQPLNPEPQGLGL
jgi:hypothetical protein